jgi:hypothetical protein
MMILWKNQPQMNADVIYEKACLRNITLLVSAHCFNLNLPEKINPGAQFVKVDHKN